MSIKATSISAASFCLIGCALSGCSGPKLEYAEVEGKVTLNGAPLVGAMIRFYPVSDGAKQAPYAVGLTDADGIYVLTHHDNQPGAVVGKSRVVVSWPSRDLQSAVAAGRPAGPPGPPIPLPYTTAADTPLLFEVQAGPRQMIDLRLEE